jgi:PAS domain S-box-containing protein
MPAPDSTAADAPDPAVPSCRTRRVVLSAGAAVAVSMTLAVTSYVGEWQDVVVHGADPGADEWLALAGALWLPVVIVALTALFRQHARLSAQAERATELFRDTAHTASGWIWQIDVGYRITYSSAGVLDLLGHHPADVIGRNPMDLLVFDEDRERIDADVQATFSTGGWHNWQTRVKHRDGSVRYVRSSATPVYGKNGDLLAYRGFTSDVTAEVEATGAESRRAAEHAAAAARIERALADPHGLQMVFQPIVGTGHRGVVGVEALSRFPAAPHRPPNEWFDEAWQVGHGPDLELRALREAYRYLAALPPAAYLSLNISPATMLEPRFAAFLDEVGADAARIVIEVTEHAAVADYDALSGVLRQLRSRGIRLAVDDAGAGYASLQHILRLRPDIIKLDRGIVAGADSDPARAALVVAMSSFAASLGMAVVAEGVENEAELCVLADAGIPYAQGFHLGRPAAVPLPDRSGRIAVPQLPEPTIV